MFKAYLKASEMVAHGAAESGELVKWCRSSGVVRVEVELKRRLLQELGLDRWECVTDEALRAAFHDECSVLRRVDRSDEPDILSAIPSRSRAYAAAWLAGKDLRQFVSRATLFRHARVLREYGLDVLTPRNVLDFPVAVRVVDLVPMDRPEWYDLDEDAA